MLTNGLLAERNIVAVIYGARRCKNNFIKQAHVSEMPSRCWGCIRTKQIFKAPTQFLFNIYF